jgi:hypothetical protein
MVSLLALLVSFVLVAEVTMPPLACIYEPTVPYTVTDIDLRYIPAVCGKPYDRRILACTYLDRDDIFMPKVDGKEVTQEVYDAILIHEKGHVNCDDWHPNKLVNK